MKFTATEIAGVMVIEPDVFADERGFFLETYHREKYWQGGLHVDFVQDNHSLSSQGIVRGLHAQASKPQGKLVRAIEGEIFDVAVDLRAGSPTYRRWVAAHLSAENFRQLYVPPGLAHGFAVISKRAQVEYKCTDFYDPADEVTVRWNDPTIGIDWPIDNPTLSERDRAAPLLAEVEARFSTPSKR